MIAYIPYEKPFLVQLWFTNWQNVVYPLNIVKDPSIALAWKMLVLLSTKLAKNSSQISKGFSQ